MEIDFETDPITEQEVISLLGKNYKVQGDELVWACPACRGMGGDRAADNLKFNRSKHILKCFACDYGQEITSIIARRRFEAQQGNGEDFSAQTSPIYTPPPPSMPRQEKPKEKEIPQDKLDEYYWDCGVMLFRHKDILRKMFEKHSIMPKTALECNIGYDEKKDMLVFPSRAIGKDPTQSMFPYCEANGAEYREYTGEKKIRRISGYDSRICLVTGNSFAMRGIICEGYKDAYNLYQLMKITQPEIISHTAIFTVQNGTNSINTDCCLQKVNWRRFESIGLCMDNDKAGDEATELALGLFDCMEDLRPQLIAGYNDIQKRFEKEFAPQVDIEKALQASWIDEMAASELCCEMQVPF